MNKTIRIKRKILEERGVIFEQTHPIRTLKWFKNRINKRIHRDPDGCQCASCLDVAENGIIVSDTKAVDHPQYLFDTQNDFAVEGIFLNYRDKK